MYPGKLKKDVAQRVHLWYYYGIRYSNTILSRVLGSLFPS